MSVVQGTQDNISFKVGTLAQYNQLRNKKEQTIYWLYDVQQLYKGSVLYATGALASATVHGLLSKEDKQLLDLITNGEIAFKITHDTTLSVDESATLGVNIQPASQNAIQSTTGGLYVYNNKTELNNLKQSDTELTAVITNVATNEDIDNLMAGEEFEPSITTQTTLGTIVEDFIQEQVNLQVSDAVAHLDFTPLQQSLKDYVDDKLAIEYVDGGDSAYIQSMLNL